MDTDHIHGYGDHFVQSTQRHPMQDLAIHIRARSHPSLGEALIDTGDRLLVENSQYDYFWGCGRDRRGNNAYGKVLMKVRSKLREEHGSVGG